MITGRLTFVNREALAISLARKVSAVLSKSMTSNAGAILAVSGGTTPQLFFEHLSRAEISWEKVTITLVDERMVAESSPRSNAAMARQHLLKNRAAKARFVPLYENPEAARLGAFDAVVLGMGADGHTASFFPGGDALSEAIDPLGSRPLVELSAPGAGERRITFTLPRLVAARFLALHIEGEEKQRVFDKAVSGSDAQEMPIRAVLQSPASVSVYWCP